MFSLAKNKKASLRLQAVLFYALSLWAF